MKWVIYVEGDARDERRDVRYKKQETRAKKRMKDERRIRKKACPNAFIWEPRNKKWMVRDKENLPIFQLKNSLSQKTFKPSNFYWKLR